ncbi:MAG: PQQ-binding-like beta-propeller repeat protein [Bacteroidetes bacterium]|nr:PQQ-binding-like beta-propeller repeat protein [Bacteroidota bacterium]
MKNKQLAIIVLSLILVASCVSKSPDISKWRGPNEDGKFPDKGLLTEWPENGPTVAWKYDQLGKGYSSPAFTSDRFYITGTPDSVGFIYSFDHEGNLKWKKEYGPEWMLNFPGSRPTPTIYGDLGYVMSSVGVVYCFNTKDGENIWTVDLMKTYGAPQIKFGMTEVIRVDENKIYCTPGGTKSNVIALNRFTGDLVWESKGSGTPSAYCPITIFNHGGVKYLATVTALNVMALNAENGEVAWTFPTNNESAIHGNSPLYRDGNLFIMNGWENGSFLLKIAEDGKSIERVWENDLMDLENGDAMLFGDNLFGSNWEQKGFSCVDWKTGIEKFTTKEFNSGTFIFADGLFYWYGINGQVGLVKANDDSFEVISTFQLEGKKSRDHSAHPVIHKKKLYIRYDSTLWAFDIAL